MTVALALLFAGLFAFAATWTDTLTTLANYVFSDSAKITVAGGVAKLKVQKPYHLHDTKTEFDGITGNLGTYSDTEVSTTDVGQTQSGIKLNDSGLVAYYPFNGTTGAIANLATAGLEDTKGTNEGAASNVNTTGMSFASGKFGNGVSFDGVDDYVSVPTSASMTLSTQGTLSAWVKFNSTAANQRVVTHGQNEIFHLYMETGNRLAALVYDGANKSAVNTATASTGTWYHITATFDSTTLRLYVDGAQVTSTSAGALNYGLGDKRTIFGAYGGANGGFANALIDDVAIYNTALTASQIAAQYAAGVAVHMKASASITPHAPKLAAGYPGLVSYWSLDHSSGTVAADLVGANKGTLTNFPASPWAAGVNGNALTFDGVDDYISFTGFKLNSGLTYSAWVKTTSTDAIAEGASLDAALNVIGDTASSIWLGFGVHGGKVRFNEYSSGYFNFTGSTSVNDGNWHHIAVTHDKTTGGITLYADGVSDGTGTLAYGSYSSSYNAANRIGMGYAGADFFVGTLDEVAIFNRALAAGEVAYLAGKKGETATYTSPVMDGEIAAAAWDKLTASLSKVTPGMQFASSAIGSSFTGARAAASGDLDGDGDLDLAAGGTDATTKLIKWYKNNGGGTFTETSISTTVTAADIAVGDLTGDKALDFVVADNVAGGVKWYKNDGAASPAFAEQTAAQISTDASPQTVAVADINGDSYLDVVAGFGGVVDKIVWYASDGASAPTFTAQTAVATAFDAQHLIVKDINGDGSLDIVAASNAGSTIAWYKGNGGTSWTATNISAAFTGAQYVGAADMDKDGDIDIVAAGNGNATVAWFGNDGSTSALFGSANNVSIAYTSASAVVPLDFDSDGDMDLLTAAAGTADDIDWWANNGLQAFTQTSINASYGDPFDIATGDFNGDGASDFAIVSNTGATVDAFFNTPWKKTSVTTTAASSVILLGDMDRDGDLDIVASDGSWGSPSTLSWWANNGSGGGWIKTDIATGVTSLYGFALGDLDGDGDLDAVTNNAHASGGLAWWANNGSGGGWIKTDIEAGFYSSQEIQVGDLDGDGDKDVMTSNGNGNVAWWANNGSGGGWIKTNIADTFYNGTGFASLSDLDGDGDLDVVATGADWTQVAWWANNGSGGGWTKTVISNFSSAYQAEVGDLDRDGDLDVVATSALSNGGKVSWWANNGSGAFGAEQLISAFNDAKDVKVSDLDGDGNLDVVATSYDFDEVAWWANNGSGVFGGKQSIATGFDTVNWIASGDLDGDGDLDVAAVRSGSELAAFLQQSRGKVAVQARTDTSSTMANNPSFVGPDGTAASYFGAASPDGAGILAALDGKRYAQYKATFYRNDTTLDPMVKSVQADYTALPYSTANPHVTPATGQAFTYLTSFAETATKPVGSEVKYLLSPDNATTWYYHTGTAWATSDGTYAQASLASALNTNIAGFDDKAYTDSKLPENSSGTLKYRAFLNSDGTALPQLDSLAIGYETGSITMTSPNGGESWKAGTTKTLTWTGTGVIPSDLTLEYSTDGTWVSPTSIATGLGSGYGAEKDPATISGAVGVWRFNGTTGAIANLATAGLTDSAGINHGTASNVNGTGMAFAAGKYGNAVSFDGVDDYVDAGNGASLNPTNAVTISVWAKANAWGTGPALFGKGSSANRQYWCYSWGLLYFEVANQASITIGLPSTGIWHHYALTYNKVTADVYLDGSKVASANQTGNFTNDATGLQIGKIPGNYTPFNGLLDDVAIYNRALTAGEIAELAAGGSPAYNWAIPANFTASATLKVRARSLSAPAIRDASNANFTIADIAVTAPNTGVVWKAGTSKNITWTATAGVPDDLVLEYSANSGSAWNAIAGATALNHTTGTPFAWTVPSSFQTTTRVRARSASATELVDMSDADFTIADLNVAAPNGNEILKAGTAQTITWGASGAVPNDLTLEYTTNGTTYTSIATLLPAAGNDLGATGEKDPATISGAVGVWRMNEASGTTAADSAGTNTGTLTNGPTFVAGKYGNAVSFDGVDDYVSAPYSSTFDFGTGDFTYSAWIKTSQPGSIGQMIVSRSSGWNYDGVKLIIQPTSGFLRALLPVDANVYGTVNMADGTWKHVALTRQSGTARLYVNGVFDVSLYAAGNVNTANPVVVGYRNAGANDGYSYPFQGQIDDVAIYNRALTSFEVQQLASHAYGYAWTSVPAAAASATTKVRVRSVSATDLDDSSDANFRVYDLNITSPNGAESWAAGSAQNITWNQNALPGTTVKLQLSTTGAGGTFADITGATGLAKAAGTFAWSVPGSLTTNAVVRIVDESNAVVLDPSNAAFTIGGEAITVTKPAAAEALGITTVKKINWTVAGTIPTGARLKLEYSADGLANTDPLKGWNLIDTNVVPTGGTGCDVGATGCYDWAVPSAAASNTVVVRVKDDPTWDTLGAADALDGVSGVFRVVGTTSLIKPNGGEKWAAGAAHTILYQTQGTMPNVKITAAKDGNFANTAGGNIITIAASTANTGSYTWTPARGDAAAGMKIRMENAADSAVKDESDAAFSVTGITVTAPDTAARVKAGDPYTITWTQGAVSNVKIEYAEDGANYNGTVIASTPAGSGSYAWTLPLKTMTGFRVKVSDADAVPAANGTDTALTADASDASSVLYGTITVVQPNGNESLNSSNSYDVTWTVAPAGANVIPNVKIFYTTSSFGTETLEVDAGVAKPSNNNPGNGAGKYTWTPTFTSTTVKVRVADAGDPAVSAGASAPSTGQNQDDSDAFFSVTGISLTAPAGGESWVAASSHNITFGFTGTLNNVKIEYSADGGTAWTTLSANTSVTSNPYSYPWTIPDNISTNVKVRVTEVNADGSAKANAKAATSPALTITGALAIATPATLAVGDSAAVTWTKTGTITSQKLEYSTDGGTTWVTPAIATGIAGATQAWTVPDAIGTNVKLRVTDTTTRANGSPAISSTSAAFSIKSNIAITAPVVTDNWGANRAYSITGTMTGTVTALKFEYVDVATGTATAITASQAVTGATFTYSWTIPATILNSARNLSADPAKAFKIRVTDVTAGHTGNAAATLDSASFNIVYYKITWAIRDSATSGLLNALSVGETWDGDGSSAWSVTDGSLSSSGLYRYNRYGTYTTSWSKTGYASSSANSWTADSDKTVTVYLESDAEKSVQYEVKVVPVLDENTDTLNMKTWMERLGKIVNNEGLLTSATIDIFDGATKLVTITKTTAQQDLDTAKAATTQSLGFSFTYGPPTTMVRGKVYFIRSSITYSGSTYTSGNNYTVPGGQKTITDLIGAIGDPASATSLFGKLANVLASAQLAQTSAASAQTASVVTQGLVGAATDAAGTTSLFGKVQDVKALIGASTDAAGTASVYGKMAKVTAVLGEATAPATGTLFKALYNPWRALNRDNVVKSGEAVTLRFEGETGKAPTVDVYDAKNSKVVAAAAMKEVGTTGVYEYSYTPAKEGDHTVLFKESTTGALDSFVMSAKANHPSEAASAATGAKSSAESAFVFAQKAAGDTSSILGDLARLAASVGTAPTEGNAGMSGRLSAIEGMMSKMQAQMASVTGKGSAASLDSVQADIKTLMSEIRRIAATEKPNVNLENIYKSATSTETTAKTVKNSVAEVKAQAELIQDLITKQNNKPIVKQYFVSGSVILKLLVVNPSETDTQDFPLRAYLPKEATPEIIERMTEGVTLEYDANEGAYFAKGDLTLAPGETRVIEVEMTDIWVIEEGKMAELKDQAEKLNAQLKTTVYASRAEGLYNNVIVLLHQIFETQNDLALTPQEHIALYRENMRKIRDIELDLIAMRRFLAGSAGSELPQEAVKDLLAKEAGKSPVTASNWDAAGKAAEQGLSVQGTWKMIFGILGFIGAIGMISFGVWQRELQQQLLRHKSMEEPAPEGLSDAPPPGDSP